MARLITVVVLLLLTACGQPDREGITLAETASPPPSQTTPATPTSKPSPAPPAAPSTRQPASAAPASDFVGTQSKLSAAQRERMTPTTWRAGCPIALDDLRLLELSYWDGKGSKRGRLIVHADSAGAMLTAFRRLYDARYPISKMRLMDDYDGDDDRSMNDNNTSAFNCRNVKGTSRYSQHSYGRAIDVNPFKNPWVKGGTVDPPGAKAYADRSNSDPQLIRHGDEVWDAFASVGWEWGGDWSGSKDYQHFSRDGR